MMESIYPVERQSTEEMKINSRLFNQYRSNQTFVELCDRENTILVLSASIHVYTPQVKTRLIKYHADASSIIAILLALPGHSLRQDTQLPRGNANTSHSSRDE